MFEKMDIPSLPASTEQMLHYSRYFSLIGLLIPLAIVITLLVTRRKFYEATNRAWQLAATPPSPTD
jgi:type II secretory pathway component PulF